MELNKNNHDGYTVNIHFLELQVDSQDKTMVASDKVWGDKPVYYKQPIRWFRYHAHVNPALFTAVLLGASAPVLLLLVPFRRKYLYPDHEPVPFVYPLPQRPRDKNLTGYDD